MPITNFKGLTDTYLDTSAYNIDPAFQNLYMRDPKDIDTRRWNAYRYFMDFYKGRHWEETGEFNPAYGNRSFLNEEFNRRSWNASKNIVDKLVAFFVKDAFTVSLPPALQEVEGMQDIIDQVWEANDKERFCYDMALMGCITGDCFIKVSYDADFFADDVGELVFEVLDSRTVLPFFDGKDRRKLIGARIQYPINRIDPESGEKEKVLYQEVHTESTIMTFIDGEVETNTVNPLNELMIIHIRNEPLPYERFGRSDLEDLIIPQKEYNEKVSDLSEILAYHAAPITIIKGARVQQLEKGARKVWGGIPKDGSVENLGLDTDLTATLEYLDKLMTHLCQTGDVPQEAMGALQNVSNTSGSALHLQYQPILDRTGRKQIHYGDGLKQLNKLIIRFYEAVGALDIPDDIPPSIKYKTTIKWGDVLPRDRSIDLADISTEIGLGIESKKGALKRLGEENPEHKLEEISEEMMDQAEQDFMAAGLSTFGDSEAGPEGLGTASGAEAGPQNNVQGAVRAAKTNPVTQGEQTSVQAVKKSAQTSSGANSGKP